MYHNLSCILLKRLAKICCVDFKGLLRRRPVRLGITRVLLPRTAYKYHRSSHVQLNGDILHLCFFFLVKTGVCLMNRTLVLNGSDGAAKGLATSSRCPTRCGLTELLPYVLQMKNSIPFHFPCLFTTWSILAICLIIGINPSVK